MLKRLLLLLAFIIGIVYSERTVNFKVIAFGKDVEVEIEDKKYIIKKAVDVDPLFTGKIKTCPNNEFEYKYILDGVPEPFTRKASAEITETYNEFYGREETIKQLGQFQYPDNHWNRSIGKTSLFDDSYIPTIHFSGNNTEEFFHNPKTGVKAERVTIYLKDSKKSFLNAPITAKNKDFDKFQIRLTLSKKSNIKNRYLLKFRNGSEDPLNLRQTIYGNIIQTIGIPSIHSVMVRVYYNGKPAGFYTMQEEAYSESFIRAEFYGDPETGLIDAPEPVGDTFDCSTGADFEYRPTDLSFYDPIEPKIYTVKNDRSKVIALTKALHELDTTDEKAVDEFDKKWFDIETFHKAMCMEYLTGDWDGYWYFTSNFALYQDPNQSTDSTYKFYFITQDHDETFGIGLTDTVMEKTGHDFPKQSYRTMLNKIWHGDSYDAYHRTLVDKLIASTPKLQQRFQDTLISIVQNIFNPVAFPKVVETYFERYRPEVEWDYSFERPYHYSKPMNPNWHYEDFLAGFNNSLPGVQWSLYEWVTLRAEAIKNEFCITWEGDENPPNDSCIPFIPDSNKKDNTTETVTETMPELETTTIDVLSTITAESTIYYDTTIVETSTIAEPTNTSTSVTPTNKSTKTIPANRGGLSNWLKNKKPSDFQNKSEKSTITTSKQIVQKSKI